MFPANASKSIVSAVTTSPTHTGGPDFTDPFAKPSELGVGKNSVRVFEEQQHTWRFCGWSAESAVFLSVSDDAVKFPEQFRGAGKVVREIFLPQCTAESGRVPVAVPWVGKHRHEKTRGRRLDHNDPQRVGLATLGRSDDQPVVNAPAGRVELPGCLAV